MHDQKKINALVSKIANRGGSSNQTPTPGVNFGTRMALAKKTARAASQPTAGVSSNAPPNKTQANKTGGKPVQVQQAATKVPAVKQGKKGPTMQTGPGKGSMKGGHTFHINIRNA